MGRRLQDGDIGDAGGASLRAGPKEHGAQYLRTGRHTSFNPLDPLSHVVIEPGGDTLSRLLLIQLTHTCDEIFVWLFRNGQSFRANVGPEKVKASGNPPATRRVRGLRQLAGWEPVVHDLASLTPRPPRWHQYPAIIHVSDGTQPPGRPHVLNFRQEKRPQNRAERTAQRATLRVVSEPAASLRPAPEILPKEVQHLPVNTVSIQPVQEALVSERGIIRPHIGLEDERCGGCAAITSCTARLSPPWPLRWGQRSDSGRCDESTRARPT